MESKWEYGFLSKCQSKRLPCSFEPWESIVNNLPALMKEHQLRDKVHHLSLLTVDESSLLTEEDWQRTYCVITFISQAYIAQSGEGDPCTSLPKQLAIPWTAASSHFGLPPSPNYAAFVLWNWHLKNPDESLSTDNFEVALSFTGGKDEAGFYIIHMRIELAAAPGIKAVVACIEAIKKDDQEEVMCCLKIVTDCISSITDIIKEVREKCKPHVFYHELRVLFSGSKEGIKYEGTSDTSMRKYPGVSGIQSSVIPLFDIFLGIKLEEDNEAKKFLDKVRDHMPYNHRQFLSKVNEDYSRSNLRAYVQQLHSSNSALTKAYNSCVKELLVFRQEHFKVVTSFIFNQSEGTTTDGTAGSSIGSFLKTIKETNKSAELPE